MDASGFFTQIRRLSTTGDVIIIAFQRASLHLDPGLSYPPYRVFSDTVRCYLHGVAYVYILQLNRRDPASVLSLTTSQAHVCKCL